MKVYMSRYFKSSKPRKIDVRIDNYDVWGLDHTLALIIAPALNKLRDQKHGAPLVDDDDVPEEIKRTSAPPKEHEWETDDNHFKRWDYVLDEMIWAFQEVADDVWEDQFYTGEADIYFEPIEGGKFYEMKRGPKDTHVFDYEGYKKHQAKIQNGIRLFAKYYFSLWD